MSYGHFDDKNREYVITTPKTPLPWINYLGSEDFFSIVSHQGAGYCFYRDAKLRRLLRYRYNQTPADIGARAFYVDDGGDLWTPTHMPMKKELDFYECRHGLGTTTITGERNGVRVALNYYVPLGDTAEVCAVTIENRSGKSKSIKLYSMVEFCLWEALDDMTNFQRNLSTGEVEIARDGATLIHKTEYRERRNHYAFFHVDHPVEGFDTDRASFMGTYNGWHEPEAVLSGGSRNSVASGWSPVGSHSLVLDLPPDSNKLLTFVLGYVEVPEKEKWASPGKVNQKPIDAMVARLCGAENVACSRAGLRSMWDERLGFMQVTSGDPRLDRMVNIWNPYQCMVTYHMSRSASSFESGIGRGMGFRDSNQDLLGVVHIVPDRAKARILDIAATQRKDGSAYHQYQPLTKRGNDAIGSGFNDDPLWLILSTAQYIGETGDAAILDTHVAFDHDIENGGSLFDHLRASFDHVLERLGPHGLPLIGRADWNDCLNLNCFSTQPGESFQTTENKKGGVAESVMIAGLFLFVAPLYERIARDRGLADEAERVRAAAEKMRQAVWEHGRAENWFLRAYDFYGNKVGSPTCEDGQIYIESQGFCVMAGVGVEDGFAERALDSVAEHLGTPHGLVLLHPTYRDYHVELGEVSSYPPGYKENGGIFCHNNPWIMIAETKIGRADRALDYWKRIAPSYREESLSAVHRTEPYVYSQMIAGKAAVNHGEAKNSWLTGTAAWCYVAITQYLLGIRAEVDGLRVEPCMPGDFGDFTIDRVCRGAHYEIRVHNTGAGGPIRLRIDGEPIDGTLVPHRAPRTRTVVDVTL